MSAPAAVEVLDAQDLADLDLVDDSRRHARCVICTGMDDDLLGVPFTALCGRRAINLRAWNLPDQIPPDACEECLALFWEGCPNEANHPKPGDQ